MSGGAGRGGGCQVAGWTTRRLTPRIPPIWGMRVGPGGGGSRGRGVPGGGGDLLNHHQSMTCLQVTDIGENK